MKHRKRNNESESEDSQEYESEEEPKITSGVMELKNQESKSWKKLRKSKNLNSTLQFLKTPIFTSSFRIQN
jgi:hypothetical protein